MQKKLRKAHDKFFKEVFSRKEEVIAYINGSFPEELKSQINFDSLKLESESYINEDLEETFSDLVYSCLFSETPIKISLLFEHKSFQPDIIYIQLLKYILGIWEGNLKKKTALMPIIPIVIYHGKKTWQHKTFDAHFDKFPKELLRFFPNFEYILTDLTKLTEQEIQKFYHSIFLQVSFLLMKNIFDNLALVNNLDSIVRNLDYIDDNELAIKISTTIFTYIFHTNSEENYVKILEKIEQISKHIDMYTIAESLIDKGKRLGIDEGKRLGIDEGKRLGIDEGKRLGINEGKRLGKRLGIEKNQNKTALKMILAKLSDEIILKLTEISPEKLNRIKVLADEYGEQAFDFLDTL